MKFVLGPVTVLFPFWFGMAEAPINGTLKVTLVTAKGLKTTPGAGLPNSVMRFRILNSDPNNLSEPPSVSQVQVRHHVETTCLSGCPLSRIVTVRALVLSNTALESNAANQRDMRPNLQPGFPIQDLGHKACTARLCSIRLQHLPHRGQWLFGRGYDCDCSISTHHL